MLERGSDTGCEGMKKFITTVRGVVMVTLLTSFQCCGVSRVACTAV